MKRRRKKRISTLTSREGNTMKEDKETEEFIKGMLRLIEPILAEDWESEADEWWEQIKGVKVTDREHKEARQQPQ